MRRVCFHHAGCPDGFGAAWAVWKAWGDEAVFLPCGHDESIAAEEFVGDEVVFVDIAPANERLAALADRCALVTVLDHHVSSRTRFESDPSLANRLAAEGHPVVFDLDHSGAVLAWSHFHPGREVPTLLRYVQDQDLWNWKLPYSEEVNAAIGSYPHRFDVWDELASRSVEALAGEGTPIVRANRTEVARIVATAHPIALGTRRIEAVNATHRRSDVGHELARRAAFGPAWGCVYRVVAGRVDASLYSIGDVDVSKVAAEYGGGGHLNAAGFSVPLETWLRDFV